MLDTLSKKLSKIFGSRNDRLLRRYRHRAAEVGALESQVARLTDAELKAKAREFRDRCAGGTPVAEFMPEVLAVAREAMDRFIGLRSAFKPGAAFDPSVLPADLQPLFARVKAEADALPPLPAAGGEGSTDWPQGLPGYLQAEVPVALYEAIRALYPESRPPYRCRPFDVQLIGGMVLGEGRIAEMRTGEGKTIVAPLACFVAWVEGLKCVVVTVNDYLVQRDRDWVFPFYHGLGLSVGAIHPQHMQSAEAKKDAYECDVLYGTSSELGFDYLRDNMKSTAEDQVQKRRDFVIIDEVDSILIDEARTPLIISGPAHARSPRYALADQVARHLAAVQAPWAAEDEDVQALLKKIKGLEGDIRSAKDKSAIPGLKARIAELEVEKRRAEGRRDTHVRYFEVERDRRAVHLTHKGVTEAQKRAGIGSFYVSNNLDFPHLLENALKAHVVYQRDREYVVENGEVVIVDEFTGRKMVGRQWSDGLHQAVECKEQVRIKEETQTMATVTVQNYFKLYKRRAGMTGTAITEATEFWEIYSLDVVAIPTHRQIRRLDRDDLIYLSQKDKWNAILEEIRRMHDTGRPVLVGTTSVEKSETLSRLLTAKHGIRHEVLNAKQHERESHIVEHAGELGSVMIATNMAGRGTDIKLRAFDRAQLLAHWEARSLVPPGLSADLPDAAIFEASWRWQAMRELGMPEGEAKDRPLDEIKLALMRRWVARHHPRMRYEREPDARVAAFGLADCEALLDETPDFQRHRLSFWRHCEEMGGLHIVGTERHESRRIDNQLRGRSGRQGDRGSSRFFLALDDDLMKYFAGDATIAMMSKVGMKEGDAIESSIVSRVIQGAQKKVEERNYEQRKSLIEYDEVMEQQRRVFYGARQQVLERDDASQLVLGWVADAIDEAAETYMGRDYAATQVAEWCRRNLDLSVDPAKLRLDGREALADQLRALAADDGEAKVRMTVGEYVLADAPEAEWDLRALAEWMRVTYGLDIVADELKGRAPADIAATLVGLVRARADQLQLDALFESLDPTNPLLPVQSLARMANATFGLALEADALAALKDPSRVATEILKAARAAYRQRERGFGVEVIVNIFEQGFQQDPAWALDRLHEWYNRRFGPRLDRAGFEAELQGKDLKPWLQGACDAALAAGGPVETEARERAAALKTDLEGLKAWLEARHGVRVGAAELAAAPDLAAFTVAKARGAFRADFARMERHVLLSVLDDAWRNHLYAMDQLRDAVNLHAYAEKDPKTEHKKRGTRLFQDMWKGIHEQVARGVFNTRMNVQVQQRPPADFDLGAAAGAMPDGMGEAGRAVTVRQKRAAAAGQWAGDGDFDGRLAALLSGAPVPAGPVPARFGAVPGVSDGTH